MRAGSWKHRLVAVAQVAQFLYADLRGIEAEDGQTPDHQEKRRALIGHLGQQFELLGFAGIHKWRETFPEFLLRRSRRSRQVEVQELGDAGILRAGRAVA